MGVWDNKLTSAANLLLCNVSLLDWLAVQNPAFKTADSKLSMSNHQLWIHVRLQTDYSMQYTPSRSLDQQFSFSFRLKYMSKDRKLMCLLVLWMQFSDWVNFSKLLKPTLVNDKLERCFYCTIQMSNTSSTSKQNSKNHRLECLHYSSQVMLLLQAVECMDSLSSDGHRKNTHNKMNIATCCWFYSPPVYAEANCKWHDLTNRCLVCVFLL